MKLKEMKNKTNEKNQNITNDDDDDDRNNNNNNTTTTNYNKELWHQSQHSITNGIIRNVIKLYYYI